MQIIIARVKFPCPACGNFLTEKERWYGREWICTKCKRTWGIETFLPVFINIEKLIEKVMKEIDKIPYSELTR